LFNNKTKTNILGNLLYLIAIVLIIGWAIGFFVYGIGGLINLLLLIAIIVVVLRIIKGNSLK